MKSFPGMRHLLGSALLFSTAVLLPAAEPPPSGILEKLASEQFAVREEAQADLLAWGLKDPSGSLDAIYGIYRGGDDPEVRQRCYAVLLELIADDFSRQGQGFIGISMVDVIRVSPDEGKTRFNGISVAALIPCMAGEKSGLRLGDIIYGIDHLEKLGEMPSVDFRNYVQNLKPGTEILLKVMRGKELLKLKMVIGRRPAAADDQSMSMWSRERIEMTLRQERETYLKTWLAEREKAR